MSNAVVTMGDIEKMAIAVAKSGLFGVKRPEEAMALMLVAQAEGRHPALAARDYDIIQGRPAKKTEAMLRDFLESGGKVEWHDLTDTNAEATFSHPSGGTVKISWDMNRAKAAGLASRDMWRKYPRQMLRSRCVSEGIRTVCPMATSGMYVPEEVRDFAPEKDITPAATPRGGARERLSHDQREKVDAVAGACQEHLDNGSAEDAALELDNAALDADEMVYFWDQFDAKAGKAIAKAGKALRDSRKATALPSPEVKAGQISEAQRRRLEATISGLAVSIGLDREAVKAHVKESYGLDHFSELSKEQYAQLDDWLTQQNAAPPPATDATEAVTSSGQSAEGAAPIDGEKIVLNIELAETVEKLEEAAKQAALLPADSEYKAVARSAYAKRKKELKDAA